MKTIAQEELERLEHQSLGILFPHHWKKEREKRGKPLDDGNIVD
jgi:hypothetical protein